MHQIRFRMGLRPGPLGPGACMRMMRSPDLLVGFGGRFAAGGGAGWGRGGKGEGGLYRPIDV